MKATLDLDPTEVRAAMWLLQKIYDQIKKAEEEQAEKEAPTLKQINYAKALAERKGLLLPDFGKITKEELSRWIEGALSRGA